ncbi:MAG: hypothetical protein ABC537_04000 [Candidatus Methanosuratincola sp.]
MAKGNKERIASFERSKALPEKPGEWDAASKAVPKIDDARETNEAFSTPSL